MKGWPAVVAISGALFAGGLVLVDPGWAGRAIQLYVALLGVLTASILIGRVRSAFVALPADALSTPGAQVAGVGSSGFERAYRFVELGLSRGDDFEQFLRPELTLIASRLLLRHGVVAEAQPDRAAALLGPALWRVVRPGRLLTSVSNERVDAAELSVLLDRLEALA